MNKIFQIFVVAALVVIFAFLIIIYIFLFRDQSWPPRAEARFLAQAQLKQLKTLESFKDLRTGRSLNYFNLDGSESSIYEVELIDLHGEQSGYMVVSLDQDDFPIKEFAAEGPGLRSRLKAKIGHDRFRPVWLTPTFTIAIDKDGNTLAREGNYIRKKKPAASEPSKASTDQNKYQMIVEEEALFKQRNKPYIQKARSSGIFRKKKSTDLVTDYPEGNFFQYLAEGVYSAAELQQIDANTGANSKNYASGCGPTAWAMLIAWHDLVWNPELLRGSQDRNGLAWGPAGNPNTEAEWNTYIDRITMRLATHLGTFNDDGEGATYDDDMDRGFDFIRTRLNKQITGNTFDTDHGDAVQGVYDIMVFDSRPALVGTPGHYSVASGFLFNWDDPTSIDNQWLYLNTGWGYHKYIQSLYLDSYWYFRDVTTSQKTIYNEASSASPSMITTVDASGYYTKLWVFWRGTNGKIQYMTGDPQTFPSTTDKVVLDIEAKYSPVLTSRNGRIIMAYVDTADKIKLLLFDPGKGWSPLNFPDITTAVRPAICGWFGDWLTVAFSDREYGVQVIATNAIDIDAHDAWPRSVIVGSTEDGKYWNQFDFLGTNAPLSMVRSQSLQYVAWNSNRRNGDFYYIHVGGKHGSGNHAYMTKNFTPGGVDLAIVNDDLYLVYRGWDNRLIVDAGRYRLNDAGVWVLDTEQKAYLRETSNFLPAVAVMERENGAHPSLLVTWLGAADKINIRELSIDTEFNPMNYASHPNF